MSVGKRAREAKHSMFLLRKRVAAVQERCSDGAATLFINLRPWDFDLTRYRHRDGQMLMPNFLHFDDPTDGVEVTRLVTPRLFALWTGENQMSNARVTCLNSLRDVSGVEVVLVTTSNLHEWILESHPLHVAYEHLSMVHRSDYLRCYLMHYHGGGYSDIKSIGSSWIEYFDYFEVDPSLWVLGYPEPESSAAANVAGRLGRDIRRYYSRLAGNGAFICRPGTQFTREWLGEVERRLNYYAPLLALHPARDPWGSNDDYPVPWTGLQAQVFQPLQLKFAEHVRTVPMLTPSFRDHR